MRNKQRNLLPPSINLTPWTAEKLCECFNVIDISCWADLPNETFHPHLTVVFQDMIIRVFRDNGISWYLNQQLKRTYHTYPDLDQATMSDQDMSSVYVDDSQTPWRIDSDILIGLQPFEVREYPPKFVENLSHYHASTPLFAPLSIHLLVFPSDWR